MDGLFFTESKPGITPNWRSTLLRHSKSWIEGSIAKAMILLEMRNANPANKDFGEALSSNGIDLGHEDRAALLGLARLGQDDMRRIFERTNSRSYRIIWQDNKPALKVI